MSAFNPLSRALMSLVVVFALGACAHNPAHDEVATLPHHELDPWEDFNRSVYALNKGVDKAILRPVASTYEQITPKPARTGITNFFTNLGSPWITGQLLLQGRFKDGSEQMGRFLINTVYGVGGIWDVADRNRLPEHETDVGATLARWGWKESNFVMLPLLGPSSVRDGVGQVTQILVDPVDKTLRKRTGPAITALEVVQIRASLLDLDDTIAESYDEYAFIRDGWLQRRQYQLFGEEASLPDYEEFLEDEEQPYAP